VIHYQHLAERYYIAVRGLQEIKKVEIYIFRSAKEKRRKGVCVEGVGFDVKITTKGGGANSKNVIGHALNQKMHTQSVKDCGKCSHIYTRGLLFRI
jgi:hypothetical protein